MNVNAVDENSSLYTFQPFRIELLVTSCDGSIPAGRGGHRIVCNSKDLFVFGGYNPDLYNSKSGALKELWKFKYALKQWTEIKLNETCPNEVISIAAIRRKQKLLVFGGSGEPLGLKSSNKLHSINLNTENGFKRIGISSANSPYPMYGQAIVMHKNVLFTIGGTNGFTYKCDIHCVNLNKSPRTWKQLYVKTTEFKKENESNIYEPKGRFGHTVGFDGNNIYLFGGGTTFEVYNLIEIPTFNVKSKIWTCLRSKGDPNSFTNYPEPRRSHASVQLKTDNDIHIYITGGCLHNERVHNDLWRLELSTLQWKCVKLDVFLKPLFSHDATVTKDGKMYIFGGIECGPDLLRTNNIYTTWVQIPKLSEIVWEAVLYYFRKHIIKRSVINSRAPSVFIDRFT